MQANSQSCNNVNGMCMCKPGYMGTNCESSEYIYIHCTCIQETHAFWRKTNVKCLVNTVKDTMLISRHSCHVTGTSLSFSLSLSSTWNHYLTLLIIDLPFSLECASWTFGDGCQQCTCERDKTSDCNFVSGVCTCFAGYKGTDCKESKLIQSLISTNTKCIYKAFDLVI